MTYIPKMFSHDNPKAVKAGDYGYLNAIHYLAPSDLSGVNLCPKASNGCIQLCLGWKSGQAGMVSHDADLNATRKSRIEKAKWFMADRNAYMMELYKQTVKLVEKSQDAGLKLCVRLNGSSDIGWEGIPVRGYRNMMEAFPEVQFVDYTKIKRRAINCAEGVMPSNYHLTFSRSEVNEDDCDTVLAMGGNVAVVFANGLPTHWHDYPVINGDNHDLRHLDPPGVVVGLSPKGRAARQDASGFVVR